MFDWLFEGLWQVYAVLGLVALMLLVLWWRHRRQFWLYGVAILAALALVYLLLDFTVETPREQIGGRLQAMSRAVHNRDLNVALTHIADNFSWEGKSKSELRTLAEPFVKSGMVTDVVIWDFRLVDITATSPPIANVTFKVKPKGNSGATEDAFYRCDAQFERQPDNRWLLKGFRLFNPINNEPISPRDWGVSW